MEVVNAFRLRLLRLAVGEVLEATSGTYVVLGDNGRLLMWLWRCSKEDDEEDEAKVGRLSGSRVGRDEAKEPRLNTSLSLALSFPLPSLSGEKDDFLRALLLQLLLPCVV